MHLENPPKSKHLALIILVGFLLVGGGITYAFHKKAVTPVAPAEQAAVSAPLPLKEQIACTTLLSVDGYLDAPVAAPLSCDLDIGHLTPLQILFAADSTITVSHNSKNIFTLSKKDQEFTDSSIIRSGVLETSPVAFEDINNDGYKDLEVKTNSGAYNFTYDYYVYNPSTSVFDLALGGIVNPQYDAKAQTITTFDKGRGLGDMYDMEIYHFQDGKYVLIEEDTQDIINYDDPKSSYTLTIRKLQNGKMVVTKTETRTHDEVFAGNE